MKQVLLFLAFLFVFMLFVCIVAFADVQVINSLSASVMQPPVQAPILENGVLKWVSDNWAVIALVVSEALAFVPSKVSGIAHAVFSVLNAVFSRKNK